MKADNMKQKGKETERQMAARNKRRVKRINIISKDVKKNKRLAGCMKRKYRCKKMMCKCFD